MALPLNRKVLRKALGYGDMLVALSVVFIIIIIIVPIPAFLLDILFTFNIAFSLVVLLLTMFTTETLQFSVFPSLLLVATLFRLALNVSSTRLILRDAAAGEIIAAFGNFVVGGNYVVGFIIFIIITVIQFVVITNGAGRVAEVAARFTLDAMPGKQMSIDADFNAGLIDESQARERRKMLQQEADFYGAMDGASKFVKGDAIAGLIIVLINILGGLAIGVIQLGYPLEEAIRKYALLTVGDGLVSQVPAVLISTAAGILITRSSNQKSLGDDLSSQLFGFPKVIALTAGVILTMGLVPGLPFVPFFILAAAAGSAAYLLHREERESRLRETGAGKEGEADRVPEPENFLSLISVDYLEVELGYNLLPLTDRARGGDLLERVTAARRQFALETGLVVQPIRIRDNLQLDPDRYVIKLKSNAVGTGQIKMNYYLAMNPGGAEEVIEGIPTREPAFGLEAIWIPREKKDEAEMAGYTVVDETTVLLTHLTEIIRNHAHELLGRQEVKALIDRVKESHQAVVEELVPGLLSFGDIQKVLQNLLKERVPIRDLVTILETLADNAASSKDIDYLTEMARQALARTICHQYSGEDNTIYVLTLDPDLEQSLAEALKPSSQGAYPLLSPARTQKLVASVAAGAEAITLQGRQPVILTSSRVRLPLRRLLERAMPQVAVLSFNEIAGGIEVKSMGVVKDR